MKSFNCMAFLCFSVLGFTLLPQTACAYIDPGSGSAIMSTIVGFFVAVFLVIKTYWYKIKAFFLSSKKSNRGNDKKPNNVT